MELYLKIAQVTQIRKEYTIRFGRQCYPLVSHLGTLLESLTPSIKQIPPKRKPNQMKYATFENTTKWKGHHMSSVPLLLNKILYFQL